MGQILFTDRTGALSYSNPNVAMAASVSSPAYLTIGGSQFTVTAQLSVSTGSLTAQNLYYIYAVQTAGVVSIVVSTRVNSLGPSGFNSWKLIGAFYTDNSVAFNAFVSTKSITTPTFSTFTASGTHTIPPQTSALIVRVVGGGGGGSGSGDTGGNPGGSGGPGGQSSYGGLVIGNGGFGGVNAAGGAGGAAGGGNVINSPAIPGARAAGNAGAGSSYQNTGTNNLRGGNGGAGVWGGGGTPGIDGVTNTGSGGSGGSVGATGQTQAGTGGGSGGFAEAVIPNPTASSYSVTIGNGGTAGAAGGNGSVGYQGGSGLIVVQEIKPNLEQLKDL